MPIFASTKDILIDNTVYHDDNWYDRNTIYIPPTKIWDYSRELKIEDVDLWEVIFHQGGQVAVYGAWEPYAEFYMVRVGWYLESKGHGIETYYGPGAQKIVAKRIKDLTGIDLGVSTIYVDPEDAWLFTN